jgi:polysaccharide pyruvyl transferase WcaK-like protein
VRILVEPTSHHHLNVGDVAMLLVGVRRLRRLFPGAAIDVLSDDPERLRARLPEVRCVPAAARQLWLGGYIGDRVHARLPISLSADVLRVERWARRRSPAAGRALNSLKVLIRGQGPTLLPFRNALRDADLFVVTGAGAITDAFSADTATLLTLISVAHEERVPVVMLSQGFGPLESGTLRAAAAKVLPDVRLIALREGRFSPALLTDFGVAPERVVVTGDDAIELAYSGSQVSSSRSGLGLSLRIASYSGVDSADADRIGLIVERTATALKTAVIWLPMSGLPGEEPVGCAYDTVTVTGDPYPVLDRIQSCRIVVTGSYHAAVFALAQGIPAVGLSRSAYYATKFHGLRHQFPSGCAVVDIEAPGFEGELVAAISAAWRIAPTVQKELLGAAANQIERGLAGYSRIATEVVPPRAMIAEP